jgi:hypothetical protein
MEIFMLQLFQGAKNPTLKEFGDNFSQYIMPVIIDKLIAVENDKIVFNKAPFLSFANLFKGCCSGGKCCGKCKKPQVTAKK